MTKTTSRTRGRRSRRDPARLPFRWAMKPVTREGEMYRRAKDDGRAEAALLARHGWMAVARAVA